MGSIIRNRVGNRVAPLVMNQNNEVSRLTLKKFIVTKRLLKNCAVYGDFYGGAELSHQILTKKILSHDQEESYDFISIGRYWLIGSTYAPTFLFFWCRFLDKVLVGNRGTIICCKILLDQLLITPLKIALFYISMSVMEGRRNIFEECENKLWKTFRASCVFWFPALMINHTFIALNMRVFFTAFCSFIWTNVLCVFKQENLEKDMKNVSNMLEFTKIMT